MVRDGAPDDQATAQVWLIDKQGLLTRDMNDLRDFQRPYARDPAEVSGWGSGHEISLLHVVRNVKPTILLGTSTVQLRERKADPVGERGAQQRDRAPFGHATLAHHPSTPWQTRSGCSRSPCSIF